MSIPLHGVGAALVFLGMIALSFLFILIGIIVNLSSGNKQLFLRLAYASLIFFVFGLSGAVFLWSTHNPDTQIFWDNACLWILLSAAILSFLIRPKKKNAEQ